jgi:hypothetical protein
MPPKPRRDGADTVEILRDLLIVQLGLAGVPQQRFGPSSALTSFA